MSRNTGAFRDGPHLGNTRSGNGLFEGVGAGVQDLTERVTYFNDFNDLDNDYVTTSGWSLNQISGAGSAAIDVTVGGAGIVGHGHLVLDCPAAEDGVCIQYDGSVAAGLSPFGITPAAAVAGTSYASHGVFAAKIRAVNVADQGFFVGMAELDATSTVMTLPEDGITSDTHCGFYQDNTLDGAWVFGVAGDDDTAAVTSTVANALTDNEWIEIGFVMDGTLSATGYYRTLGDRFWTPVATLTPDAAWDAQMLMTMANLGGAAGDDLWVDYIYFSVRRTLVI